MDYQVLFNIVVMLCGFMGGYILNGIRSAITSLDRDIRAMPATYVSKVDYRNDIKDIKDILTRIDGKLDHKADK